MIDSVQNRILSALPDSYPAGYVGLSPQWFTLLLRSVSLLFALALAWLTYRDWGGMPLFARVIVCILVPTFFSMPPHPKRVVADLNKLAARYGGIVAG